MIISYRFSVRQWFRRVAPQNFGPFTRVSCEIRSKKAKIFWAPSARAFGAGLRPRPSATISYRLCNFWHPDCMQKSNRICVVFGGGGQEVVVVAAGRRRRWRRWRRLWAIPRGIHGGRVEGAPSVCASTGEIRKSPAPSIFILKRCANTLLGPDFLPARVRPVSPR